ncbi:RNA-binding protein 25-like, partial [Trifolium medium]|nr:RNA-binding protein 25-like [Trifolium medium]
MGDEYDNQWQTVKGRNRKGFQKKLDIATTKTSIREYTDDITTYFFTNFPDSFGANAMLRAFQHYGDVTEVVIPVKRGVGGHRFGFARFYRVVDTRRFESELDSIIIGREKISVNLSRFHRVEGERRPERDQVWKEVGRNRRVEDHQGKREQHRPITDAAHQLPKANKVKASSYVQAVKTGSISRKGDGPQHIVLSYEAANDDMERLQKAFVG